MRTGSPLEVSAAAAIWHAREEATFHAAWDETKPNLGRLSYHVPKVAIRIPDGRGITLEWRYLNGNYHYTTDDVSRIWTPNVVLRSMDGQEEMLERSDFIARAWNAVVVMRVARLLGKDHVAAAMDPADADPLSSIVTLAIMEGDPVRCEETYMHQNRITSWSGERPADPPPHEMETPWTRLRGDLLLRTVSTFYNRPVPKRFGGTWYEPKAASIAMLSHPDFGIVVFAGAEIEQTLENRRRESIGQAFGGAVARPATPVTGNARATQIIALTRQAIELDPDITDNVGTRIAPLIENHVPSLLDAHAAAMRTASARDAVDIDDELNEGLEIVRTVVEEALSRRNTADRNALRVELQFLRLRHPSALPGGTESMA